MKRVRALVGAISLKKGIAGLTMAITVFCLASFASLAAEGKVTADTAKIRAEASTDSEVVGSTVKGKVIDLLGAVKDSAGNTWYKVSVAGGGYGYIRSDLVSTSDTVPTIEGTASQTTTTAPTQTEEPEATVPTAIGEQQASINSETNVRIRSGASTKHSVVTSLPNGTNVTLIGEASDSAGNKWYQLTCNYNGRTVEGYVRSDLLTIGGSTEQPSEGEQPAEGGEGGGEEQPGEGAGEEQPAEGGEGAGEEQSPEEPAVDEHNDYEIVYTQNNEGEYEYFLYDNVNGTRQKLGEILTVVNTAVQSNQALQSRVDQEKIIIIVMAVVIVLLIVAITILAFKLREYSFEDYDEEDEEEEEEPAPAPRKKVKRQTEVYEEPVPAPKKKAPKERSVREEEPRRTQSQEQKVRVKKEDAELYAAEKKAPVKKAPARKTQNFLVDDDEFEFEFLNMDDKDL